MKSVLGWLGPFAPFLVFLVAATESAAFVGLLVPGELTVILGGVAAGTGMTPLSLTMVAAVVGAVVGDSIGYRLGSQMGPSLLDRPYLEKVSKQMDRASGMVADRGWWAIVLARFTTVLRAVIPFAAGMGKMPYRRFLLGNVIGGVAWGITFTLVGYLAGANYTRFEGWLRTGGLTLVGLGVIIGAIIAATRWARDHREAVGLRMAALLNRRPLRWIATGIRSFNRPALTLVVSAVGGVVGLFLFAGLTQDVIGTEELFFFDVSSLHYLDANRIAPLIDISRVVNTFTQPTWIIAAALLVGGVALARRSYRVGLAMGLAVAGQWLIVELTQHLVDRAPPFVTPLMERMDYGFPSEHVSLVAATVVVAAWPWTRPAWQIAVTRFGLAAVSIALVAGCRVILLIEYPSDTLAAAAAAGAWALLVCLALDPAPDRIVSPAA